MNSKTTGRYIVPTEEDYEPNSTREVLKNYLNIKSKETMEELEEQELKRAELELLKIFNENHQFTAEDICDIHELWLGDIYPFAGKYRTVTMSKDGFPFASPVCIEDLMTRLEAQYLAKFTPCHYSDPNLLAYALGLVHVELVLVHPFREGNGRTARLLANLMAMQANKPPINYTPIDLTENPQGFEQYILAIHAGMDGNYKPIQHIFEMLLEQPKT